MRMGVVLGAVGLLGILVFVLLHTASGKAGRDHVKRFAQTNEADAGPLSSLDEMAGYLQAHPERYALAAWEVGAEDAGLFHDADGAWPLTSTMKLIPLALASEEIAAGRWSNQTPTPEVETFYLPEMFDEGHARAQAERGTQRLADTLHAMVRFDDHAAADAVLFMLGRERLASKEPGLPTPHPLTGRWLLAGEGWVSDGGVTDAAWKLAGELRRGKARRDLVLPVEAQERMINELDNQGSARALAALMERLFTDETGRFSAARAELSWMTNVGLNARTYEVFAAVYGQDQPGVFTGVWYLKPLQSERRLVVALLIHGLPFATWVKLQETSGLQNLHQGLMKPGGLELLRARLGDAPAR